MPSIFSKIIEKTLPAKIVYEDDQIMAFHDINPKARVHVLIIPKKEIPTLDDAENEAELLGYLLSKTPFIAREVGLNEGYRVHIHCKEKGGQEVYHLHLHLLGS